MSDNNHDDSNDTRSNYSDKTEVRETSDKTRISPEVAKRREAAQQKAQELEARLQELKQRDSGLSDESVFTEEHADSTIVRANSDTTEFRAPDTTRINPGRADILDNPKNVTDHAALDSSSSVPGDRTVINTVIQNKASTQPDTATNLQADISGTDVNGGVGSTQTDQLVGGGHELLKGRFELEKVLGAGGMGVVYKARDLLKVEAQDREPYVAIKVLSDEFKTHPEAFIALQRESRKTQSIAHPNIVNVHDFDRDGDTVFMTMEFLEGRPLDQLISQYKSTGLPEDDAWRILEGISAALIYAHDQKIIHSDFKPGNIFVTNQTVAKVFDFGIARAVANVEKLDDSPEDKTVFDAGNLGALTPAYASLEMLQGETPDVRDDIYALGCIAYEMFTGNHPYNRVHADEALKQQIKPKRIANISKRQWRVIEKAIAFKREDRIGSVEEFWAELNRKSGKGLLFGSAAAVMIAVISVLVYQTYFIPQEVNTVSEAEIRDEIELKVSIERGKSDLNELLATPEFTEIWERKVHETLLELTELVGADDPWVVDIKPKIFEVYSSKIIALIAQEDFGQARALLENSARYSEDSAVIAAIMKQIESAEVALATRLENERKEREKLAQQQKKVAQQKRVQVERDKSFDVAMATVNKQLECRSTMNMRDIDIAVGKLRELNLSRYRKAEATIVSKLAVCISKIGRSLPERAEEFKKRAMRLFPKNKTVARIKIEPRDPCAASIAGLGARGSRAICRDVLKSEGDTFGKGPAMVVIPAKGSLKSFAISKYEITVDDFNNFCEFSPVCKKIDGSQGKFPVTKLSAKLINQYLNWLSLKSKRKYRLPTKAEWIYAARANSSQKDSNRNCLLESRGIKKGGVLIKASTGKQNPWGLVNYLGNARELVVDKGRYVAVGGSFMTPMQDCDVTKAETHGGKADQYTGFRLLREIEAEG